MLLSSEYVDLEPMQALHRNNDGYVVLAAKRGQTMLQHSVRASDIHAEIPLPANFARELGRDGFFSINSFYRPVRRQENVRWLTACYVDIDCYQAGINPVDARAMLDKMQLAGRLPFVSMYGESGRGLWAFWLLRADDGSGPARAWPETQQIYKRLQASLGERVASIGADAGARDISRVARIPGSINGKVQRPAHYWLRTDAFGEMRAYRVSELAAALNEPLQAPPPRRPRPRGTRRKGSNPGFKAFIGGRLLKLDMLRRLRGGFGEGHRNKALHIYASMLAATRLPADELAARVGELAAECEPPLPDIEAKAIIASIHAKSAPARFKDNTIADWLDITPAEAMATGFPAAVRFGPRPVKPSRPSRSERAAERDRLIREIEAEHGRRLSERETAAQMARRWTLDDRPPSASAIRMAFRSIPSPPCATSCIHGWGDASGPLAPELRHAG